MTLKINIMHMKKISIVGTAGIPACYGGFETLAENLTKYSSVDCTYTIFCSAKLYENKLLKFNNAKLAYINLNANGIQSIPYDILSLIRSRNSDVILILGVSGCIALPLLKLLTKAKIITNIDGLEWKRNKWSKPIKVFLKFSEKLAVRFSDVVIADNYEITKYVKKTYGVNARTVAYGGDHVITSSLSYEHEGYFLSLCRIEPENNVDMILNSFSLSGEKLKFVGNWRASKFGIELLNKYKNFPNIEMLDPIYDVNELFVLRSKALAYIHGHSAGGTNPSLVEMMHFKKPIFSFDCAFNRYTTCDHAIYFSDSSDLSHKIKICSADLSVLNSCAHEMKKIAVERYRWDIISLEYENIFFETK